MLWLAVRIVDYANRERVKGDALKVGGHQASSASMVTLMTALYLADLGAEDRVSVKPHASPVLHAIEYLLGRLDRSYLARLRDFGGLQAYPSRTKDPFPVDYSTGSVGLGSAAPLFGALADRFTESRLGASTGGRFISLLGDAELDEGNIWEALADPLTRKLGNVLWIVDLNRQSLDRVIPGIRAAELEAQFQTNGWEVIELKYGRRLRTAYALEGGEELRRRIDEMPNEQYQALFGADDETVRRTLLESLEPAARGRLERLLDAHPGGVGALVRDLGGHDLADVLGALRQARETHDRPTVIFAYTIKGYGLEIAGRPQNHSALLSGEQIDGLRRSRGSSPGPSGTASHPAHRRRRCSPRRGGGSTERIGPMPRRSRCRRRSPTATRRDLDTGRLRPRPPRPHPRGRRRRAARHRRARRLHVDEPRRLHQQDGRLGTGRGAGLRRHGGLAAEVARRAARPAHRDGDRGDEPRPPARPARPQLGLPARAAVPDRHPLRPVRDARPRGDRLLHLLGLAVRPRRDAVGDLARPRGRRPPVDLDPGDRDRDARA